MKVPAFDCCTICTHPIKDGDNFRLEDGKKVHHVCPPRNPANPYPLIVSEESSKIPSRIAS